MANETFIREHTAQCEAFLTVLAEAGWPGVVPEGEAASEAWVLLRLTLHALRVPRLSHRWIEAEVRDAPQTYPWHLVVVPETQRRVLFVALRPFLMLAGYQGRHPVCTAYTVWHTGVTSALMRHGWYDPATGHEPPPGHELTALECREDGRDALNNLIPGIGDALSGHRPQTEEGRRLLWYRVVDEDGEETWVNGADLPTDEDEEDNAL